ncbi:MAG: HEAT repeat domain-containing protein, partial [Candidatus Binatia bacterium]
IAYAPRPARAALAAAASALLLAIAVRGSFALRKQETVHAHGSAFEQLLEALQSANETSQLEAIHHLADSGDPHAAEAIVALLERDPSDRLVEHAAEALADLGDDHAVPALLAAGLRPLDPDLRLSLAEAVLRLGDPRGLGLVLAALRDDPPLLARRRAAELLRRYFGQDFGYGPEAPGETRQAALAKLEDWRARHEETLRWHGQKGRFE